MNFFYAIFSIENFWVYETGFSVKVPEK